MREIKFRAWDGERLKEVNSIGWVDGELDWIDTPKYNGPIDEDIKIMQYTGLKDKNGVEIYEGDICKVSYPDWYYDQHLTTNIFEVAQLRYAFRFLMDNRKTSLLFDKAKEIEKIGSIYENPELLEEVRR